MSCQVKIYSPGRTDDAFFKCLMGEKFEYVTDLKEEGDYIIVNPDFYPSTSLEQFINIVDFLQNNDKFDLCYLSELIPSCNRQGEDLSTLDDQLNVAPEKIIVNLKNEKSRLMSTCAYLRYREKDVVRSEKNTRIGTIYPPIFTHNSRNGLFISVRQLATDKNVSSDELVEKLRKLGIGPADTSSRESFKKIIEETALSFSKSQQNKTTGSCTSSDNHRSSKNQPKNEYTSDNQGSKTALAIFVLIIIVVSAGFIMSQRRNRIT